MYIYTYSNKKRYKHLLCLDIVVVWGDMLPRDTKSTLAPRTIQTHPVNLVGFDISFANNCEILSSQDVKVQAFLAATSRQQDDFVQQKQMQIECR